MGIIRGRILKTQREEMLHDQIQKAMNWDPRMATLYEDGKYYDAYGNEYIRMTFNELLEYCDINRKTKS